ncbi:Hypothetical protein KVN_LOCUS205 [uncultured virus]|nr:Hypothetical protein KVN_LOCUS205 [uncultured virus]
MKYPIYENLIKIKQPMNLLNKYNLKDFRLFNMSLLPLDEKKFLALARFSNATLFHKLNVNQSSISHLAFNFIAIDDFRLLGEWKLVKLPKFNKNGKVKNINKNYFLGVEDCRLYKINNEIVTLCSKFDEKKSSCKLALFKIKLDQNFENFNKETKNQKNLYSNFLNITKYVFYNKFDKPQKNWGILNHFGSTYVLTDAKPIKIYTLNTKTFELKFYKQYEYSDDSFYENRAPRVLGILNKNNETTNYLLMIHCLFSKMYKHYLLRFMILEIKNDKELIIKNIKLSKPINNQLLFKNTIIQYPNHGLILNDKIYLTLNINDGSNYIATMKLKDVMNYF